MSRREMRRVGVLAQAKSEDLKVVQRAWWGELPAGEAGLEVISGERGQEAEVSRRRTGKCESQVREIPPARAEASAGEVRRRQGIAIWYGIGGRASGERRWVHIEAETRPR